MKMAEVTVGMKLRDRLSPHHPVITVTELTDQGFKYTHSRRLLSPRIGYTEGGEHFGINGECLCEPVDADYAI